MTTEMSEGAAAHHLWLELRFDEPAPPPSAPSTRLLGDLLVGKGLITSGQLEYALDEQRQSGGRLGEILVAEGLLTLTELMRAVSEQRGLGGEATDSLRARLGLRRASLGEP